MKAISSDSAPKAIGPYSQAIVTEGFVFCSGQIPLDPATGELVGSNDIQVATTRVLDNVKAVLEEAGTSFLDVVKTTIFLVDLGDFQKVNEVYTKYFTGTLPARSTIQVAALPRGARVEIEVTARVVR